MSENRSPSDWRQPLSPPPTCVNGCYGCPGIDAPDSPRLCSHCRRELGIEQTAYCVPAAFDLEPVYDFEPWPMNGP